MSLPVPNLDNLEFKNLVEEAKSLIPVYAPQWTNFNPSDPGITLVELFAWFCEMISYRVDQVPEENYLSFLKLLGVELKDNEGLESGIRRAVSQFSERHRAVTAKDFELLARRGLMEKTGIREKYPDLEVRTICLKNCDLENNKNTDDNNEQFGHVSVIVILKTQNQKDLLREISEIKQYIKQYLSLRKLLTTHVHVVEPDYQDVRINLLVSARNKELKTLVKQAIEKYLDPVTGGEGGMGWPPGRNLYSSDLYHLVEKIPGIDHVSNVELEAPLLKPYQLFRIAELKVEVE